MLETKALLVETGLREFARHGLDIPSIRGICAAAGLTRGAFYTHFKDRDDFFAAVMERALEEMTLELPKRGVLRDDLGEMFRVVRGILAELSRRANSRHAPDHYRDHDAEDELRFHFLLAASDRSARVREHFSMSLEQVSERLTTILGEAQSRGEVRRDLTAEDLASHLVTQALGTLAFTSAGIAVDAARTERLARSFLAPPAQA
ncbi:MAG: TetR family transcriptional regulator [bacterium]|nr:TetR family transcriptional regulator [bacterium]